MRTWAIASIVLLAASACAGSTPKPVNQPVPDAPAAERPPAAPSAPVAETPELRDFDFVVDQMKRNYAGYPDKVPGHEAELEGLTRTARAAITADPTTGPAQIRTWLAWFHDQHVGLEDQLVEPAGAPPPPVDQAARDRELAASGEHVDVTPAEIAKAKRRGADPYAGLWEDADGTYRVLVQRPDPAAARWRAVVIASTSPAWSPGQIKFRVAIDGGKTTGTYLVRDHRELPGTVALVSGGDVLRFDELQAYFRRVGTNVALDHFEPQRGFFIRALSRKTLWIRLADFRAESRAAIEELLAQHASLLAQTPNLIIDLRYNGGGTDWSYLELMKWVYTRPIYQVGVQFRVSADNARALEGIAAQPELAEDMRATARSFATQLRAAKGEWVMFGEKPFDIIRQAEIRPNPQNIGVIITGAASSGEQFVLDSRFSRKVTLFGQNTTGMLDYSNVLAAPLPSGRHVLHYSSSRSLRLPEEALDNVGIAPDIRLGDDTGDPIAFVQRWLEARSDAAAAVQAP